jgi:hypothetical protein
MRTGAAGKCPPGRSAPPASEVPATTCPHEFFLVRIDRKTGAVEHVPHLSGVVALNRMRVTAGEWRAGAPA